MKYEDAYIGMEVIITKLNVFIDPNLINKKGIITRKKIFSNSGEALEVCNYWFTPDLLEPCDENYIFNRKKIADEI